MGLFSFIFGLDKGIKEYEKEKAKKELENEMNNYALEDWQKEEVRKGNYDSWNFEEDDKEDEDDYYHEDDE